MNPVDQLEFVESCPSIFENKPYLIIFTLENSSVISGEVRNPGIYPAFNISSPNDLLSFAGGALLATRQNYNLVLVGCAAAIIGLGGLLLSTLLGALALYLTFQSKPEFGINDQDESW